jgi:hypothetical protein
MKHRNIPSAIRTNCPFCGENVVFSIKSWDKFGDYPIRTTSVLCPGCEEKPFVTIVSKNQEKIDGTNPIDVFIYPYPKLTRYELSSILESEGIDDSLKRAYKSSISAYNIQDWNGTAAHCGRVLEGITKLLLPEPYNTRPLAQMLQILPEHINLSDPIIHLADAIKEGRNIGAHFDQEKDTDSKTATLMMDLLEYLLEYIFVLPERIELIRSRLANNQ